MEFNEKLQQLRKQRGITQDELARSLYVSRTAVSKWESGRGYPSIESLKAIASFFSVTVDDLISSDEIMVIAEEDSNKREAHLKGVVFGLLDICTSLLLFLPLFAQKVSNGVRAVSLFNLDGARLYLIVLYYAFIIGTAFFGILTLAMQSCSATLWLKIKTKISFVLGVCLAVIFIFSLQAYAAFFAFMLLIFKVLLLVKRR